MPPIKDGPTELADLHMAPWPDVDGAHVVVRQVTTTPTPVGKRLEEQTSERQGTLVGRAIGTGISYDADAKESYPTRMGPCIYLETPEDTILEVNTQKPENELLAYEPPEESDQ